MAAGTLSVTNNSKAVVGVGTTFTLFTAGDFLSLVVGQVPYTVAIASVESDTALTLVLPFDGPTATGLAWDGVKRDTMSLATMGVTVQAQKALRLMLADENNWRAIFGDEEEITVTLPNGQVMQGMSWGYLAQLMKQVDPVEMRNLQQQATTAKNDAVTAKNQAVTAKNDAVTAKDAAVAAKTAAEEAQGKAETAKTAAESAKTAAETAKSQAVTAKDQAKGFRDQAEEWAQSVNADNLLTKSGNLAGLADKTASWANLMPPGPLRVGADPIADLDAATKRWALALLNYGTAIDRWTVLSEVATKPDDGSVVEGGSLYSSYAVNGIAEADMALRIRAVIGGEYQARLGVYNRTAGRTANYDFNDRGTFSAQSLRSLGQIDSDGGITIQNQGWPGITFKSNRYASPDTQVGAMTLMEATGVDGDISTVSLIRRRGDGSSTGQIIVTFPTTAGVIALQGTSGREYKKDITDADASEAMDRINRQRLVTFVYKDDEQQRVRFGVIAEEAELIAPQYIKHIEVPVEDILDEDGNKIGEKTVDRPSVDVNPIVMDLMGCIQYLNKQVEELKAEIEAMKK